jgi:hypothetical protein
VNGVEDVSGEEIEHQGRFCKSSVTVLNSDWARSQLVKTPGASAQVCQRGRARGRLSSLELVRWAESGPSLLKHFPFSFTAEL